NNSLPIVFMSITNSYLSSNAPQKYYLKNTIVFPKNGGAVFTNKKRILSQDSVVDLNTGGYSVIGPVDLMYFYYFFSLIDFKQCFKGTALPTIDMDKLKKKWIPLPPLAEQKRIVAKIEELLPLIDRYEKAWSRLEDFNKRFPDDMQKSILQMAIQGKLVEQRPEEGTAEDLYKQIQSEKQSLIKAGKIKKEKPLPPITDGEIPFEIPSSWKWVRLCQLGCTQTGNTPAKSHPEYIGSDIPFISPGDIKNNNISYNNQALSLKGKEVARIVSADSILQVCIGGSIGKAAITEKEVSFNQQINAISTVNCSSQYLFAVLSSQYFISAMKEQAGGTATPIINKGLWDNLLIPLPPLAEQKRIVAKIEELLPLCERLK
ncbi:MAG: restriction endonuclease subunit S, partial [Lentisphaeria bacterium]|nr:restriction endonuclease subunit S [Lentisphaeria bacterium]